MVSSCSQWWGWGKKKHPCGKEGCESIWGDLLLCWLLLQRALGKPVELSGVLWAWLCRAPLLSWKAGTASQRILPRKSKRGNVIDQIAPTSYFCLVKVDTPPAPPWQFTDTAEFFIWPWLADQEVRSHAHHWDVSSTFEVVGASRAGAHPDRESRRQSHTSGRVQQVYV